MHADKGCRRRVAGESGERTEGEGGIEKRCRAEGGAEVPRDTRRISSYRSAHKISHTRHIGTSMRRHTHTSELDRIQSWSAGNFCLDARRPDKAAKYPNRLKHLLLRHIGLDEVVERLDFQEQAHVMRGKRGYNVSRRQAPP